MAGRLAVLSGARPGPDWWSGRAPPASLHAVITALAVTGCHPARSHTSLPGSVPSMGRILPATSVYTFIAHCALLNHQLLCLHNCAGQRLSDDEKMKDFARKLEMIPARVVCPPPALPSPSLRRVHLCCASVVHCVVKIKPYLDSL